MKQFTIVVECVLTDDKPIFILRDPRSGQVLKTAYSPEEVASFLGETIAKVESFNNNKSND